MHYRRSAISPKLVQLVQKRAARVILNAPPLPLAPSVPLFNRLKWLPFYKDALISKCIITYKRVVQGYSRDA